MKGINRNSMWKELWLLPAIAGGLVFFWLFPLKLLARLAARLGHSSPCPAALSWLVDNPLRRRYMRPVPDRIGIRAGEYDPDYLVLAETIRLVEAAGFRLEERFGKLRVYTANFRRMQ